MFRKYLYFIGLSLCPLPLGTSQRVDFNYILTDAARAVLVEGYYHQMLALAHKPCQSHYTLSKAIEALIPCAVQPCTLGLRRCQDLAFSFSL